MEQTTNDTSDSNQITNNTSTPPVGNESSNDIDLEKLASLISQITGVHVEKVEVMLLLISKTLSAAESMLSDTVDKSEKCEEVIMNIEESAQLVCQLLDKIDDVIFILSNSQFKAQIARLRSRRTEPNLQSVKTTLLRTKQSLAKSNQCYEKLKKMIYRVRKCCAREQRDCEMKINRREGGYPKIARAIGYCGCFIIWGIGGAFLFCTVIPTCGTSAIVATAVSVPIAGIASAAVGELVATELETTSKADIEFKKKFEHAQKSSTKLFKCLLKIQNGLVHMQTLVEDLESYADNHDIAMICDIFGRLQKVATDTLTTNKSIHTALNSIILY